MKKYFGYIRVSTVKQGEQGVSLEAQRDAIQAYAQRNNLEISDWFEEKETAAKRGRPVFDRMLKLLQQDKADGVIIHKIDRSARNLKDWAELGDLLEQGVNVLFVNEGLDLTTRGGRLSADIQAVVAADYVRNLREETKKGFYGRIKQGVYPLAAPIGYLDMGKGKPKELDPEKARLVKTAFELYSSGRYNLHGLADEMYSLGLRNRLGRRVSINSLSIMLRNPFYVGIIRLKRTGETFPGSHKPLISASLFNRVQAVLDGKLNTRIQRHDFIFRRLLECKHCGYSLIGETHKGFVYYRCHTKNCPATCIRENSVDQGVMDALSKIQFDKNELIYLKARAAQLEDKWEEEREDAINTLSLRLSQLDERLNRLTDAYVDRLIDKIDFEARKKAVLLEKKSLEDNLSRVKANGQTVPERLAKFLELTESVYLSYKFGVPEEKRDLLKIVTSNRVIDRKRVEFTLNNPFTDVIKCHEFSHSALQRDTPRTDALDHLFQRLIKYFKAQVNPTQGV